jgi:hypothetical protein
VALVLRVAPTSRILPACVIVLSILGGYISTKVSAIYFSHKTDSFIESRYCMFAKENLGENAPVKSVISVCLSAFNSYRASKRICVKYVVG